MEDRSTSWLHQVPHVGAMTDMPITCQETGLPARPVYPNILAKRWTHFWVRKSGRGPLGRLATSLALLFAPKHKNRTSLALVCKQGFVEPTATLAHSKYSTGPHCYIGDRVVIYQGKTGGHVALGERVFIFRDTIIETDRGGYLEVGDHTSIHPRCQINAYKAPIVIGKGVQIAPGCALYSYDHGIAPGTPIRQQPLKTKGPIVIGDDAWLGYGAIVLSGVSIGTGAVVAAGAMVHKDVPDGAIAAGCPAKVVKWRKDIR
jgi:acetyltransferase-like isoleucine patch superfamily enzyme